MDSLPARPLINDKAFSQSVIGWGDLICSNQDFGSLLSFSKMYQPQDRSMDHQSDLRLSSNNFLWAHTVESSLWNAPKGLDNVDKYIFSVLPYNLKDI